MARTRPAYPPEFRQEAVRLLRSSGKSIPVMARELGVSPQSLRAWASQAEIDAGETHDRDYRRPIDLVRERLPKPAS